MATPIKVLFSQARPDEDADDAITLWPSEDNWNDFGRKFLFKARFNIGKFSEYTTELKLAFLGEDRSPYRVVYEKSPFQNLPIPKKDLPIFYSLLPSAQAYREFVEHFKSKSTTILREINDLVAVGKRQKPQWWDQIHGEQNFTHGLVRSSDAYFAFLHAGDILDGITSEKNTGLSKTLAIRTNLPNFSEPHELTFEFSLNEVAPKRSCVLIGENGAGKTQLLAKIANALLRGGTEITDPSESGNRPKISRLIVLEAPRIEKSVFPRAPKAPKISYKKFSLYRRQGVASIGKSLVELARVGRVSGERRADLFLSMIKPIGNPRNIVLMTSDSADYYSIHDVLSHQSAESGALSMYSRISHDGEACWKVKKSDPVVPLSSGQACLLRFAALLCLNVERATLLLIDEPETHLHPAYIRHFVFMLEELLVQTGSAAIIATHSAYLVREVPRDQVSIMRRMPDGAPRIDKPRLRTLGADIGALSFFVFGDEVNSVVIDGIESRLSTDRAERERQIERITDDLSPEARTQLKRQ